MLVTKLVAATTVLTVGLSGLGWQPDPTRSNLSRSSWPSASPSLLRKAELQKEPGQSAGLDGVSDKSVNLVASDGGHGDDKKTVSDGKGSVDDDATDLEHPNSFAQNSQHDWGDGCGWTRYLPPPAAGDPLWEGHDPSTGEIRWKSCAVLRPGVPGSPGNLDGRPVVTQFFANEELAPPVVVDPRVLAERAIKQLAVPSPVIHLGPNVDEIYVQIPTWLWIDETGPLSASVTAGAVTVSAAATLASTNWTLGEPERNPSFTGYRPGPAVTLTCQGAGTPPPAGVDWKTEPECGHTFRWRSLPERTGGKGKWPITATTTWDVTWQSNTGQSGTTTLTATSEDAVEVGEYRILLVDGGR